MTHAPHASDDPATPPRVVPPSHPNAPIFDLFSRALVADRSLDEIILRRRPGNRVEASASSCEDYSSAAGFFTLD
jgi:hypothetical protein